ncbi:MAG: hypothetical protein NVSMB18_08410 [Acetobacteraceae bacterium]
MTEQKVHLSELPPLPFLAGETAALAQAVPFPSWQRARDRACAALLAGETRLLLIGPPGTGKTLLLHDVARILRFAGWDVTLRLTPGHLTPPPEPGDRVCSALLVDEADRLSAEELASLQDRPGQAVLLAGLNGLGAGWDRAARILLPPLGPVEAAAYVRLWLARTGQPASRLTPDAFAEVVRLSDGVPRTLSMLLGATRWIADAAGSAEITAAAVRETASLRACLLAEDAPEAEEPADEAAEAMVATEDPAEAPDRELAVAEADDPAPERTASPVIARRPRWRVPALATLGSMVIVGSGLAAAYVVAPPRQAALPPLAIAGLPHAILIRAEAMVTRVAGLVQRTTSPTAMRAAVVASAASAEPGSAPIQEARTDPAELPTAPPVAEPETTASRAEAAPASSEPVAPVAVAPVEVASVAVASVDVAQGTFASGAVASPAAPEASPAEPVPVLVLSVGVEPVAAPVLASAAPLASAPDRVAALSPGLVDKLVRRGSEMLALGDLSAARLLFGRAASSGDAGAMLLLGQTYDPDILAASGSTAAADPAAAAAWYRSAARSGNAEAASLLLQVERLVSR